MAKAKAEAAEPGIVNQMVAVDLISPHPQNYNRHDEGQIADLRASLRRFGQVRSVVVQADGAGAFLMVAGEGIWRSAKAEGFAELRADVIPAGWTPARVLAYLAADNELARRGLPDEAQLAAIIEQIQREADEELARLAAGGILPEDAINDTATDEATTDAGPQLAAIAEELQKKWRVKKGDLWQAGSQRLLCGDCTDSTAVDRLMAGALADMVFTDPPYGVNYDPDCLERIPGLTRLRNDDLEGDEFVHWLSRGLASMVRTTAANAPFYIWHSSTTRPEFEWAMMTVGLVQRHYIIWAKPSHVMSHADYQHQYEPCFYAAKQDATPIFFGDRKQFDVWFLAGWQGNNRAVVLGTGLLISDGTGKECWIQPRAPRGRHIRRVRLQSGQGLTLEVSEPETDFWLVERAVNEGHPTQKPVELSIRAINNSSLPGQSVQDLFAGSGSTIVACEQTGRIGYGMEIEPKYCAVTLERLAGMGLEPRLVDG